MKARRSASNRRPLPYFAESCARPSGQFSRAAGSSARPLLPTNVDDEREAVISRSPRDKHGGAEHRCLIRIVNLRFKASVL